MKTRSRIPRAVLSAAVLLVIAGAVRADDRSAATSRRVTRSRVQRLSPRPARALQAVVRPGGPTDDLHDVVTPHAPTGRRTFRLSRGATGRPGVRFALRGGQLARFETVLFDIDGTLVDTRATIAEGIGSAMDAVGVPRDPEQIARLVLGLSYQRVAEIVLGPGDTERHKLFVRTASTATLRAERIGEARAYSGAQRLLATLRARGVKIVAVTSRPSHAARTALGRYGLLRYFDGVVGADDGVSGHPAFFARAQRTQPLVSVPARVTAHKPNPEPILEGLALVGGQPSRAVYIGDMPTDIAAAAQAGVATVAITHGFGSRENLAAEQPDATFDGLGELLEKVRS